MGWEKLSPSNRGAKYEGPTISIIKSGEVAWNLEAHKLLQWAEKVELLYDEQAKLLGLRQLDEGGEDVFFVRKHGRASFRISATKALRYAGLLGESYKHVAEEHDGVVVIPLWA